MIRRFDLMEALMKKLKRDVEQLAVESFGIKTPEPGRGTVHGRGATQYYSCIGDTCLDSCGCVSYPDYCPESGLNHSCVWTCPGYC